MVFRQLATDARAHSTNFKHCGSDWLLHKLLTSIVWTVAMVLPMLVITSVRAGAPTFISYCYNVFYAQGAVAVGFADVQPGFLQLLLTQTWAKCTSLDSSRCVVYLVQGDSNCNK